MLSPKEFIEDAVKKIKDQIGDEKAIIALSGGVDRSVCSVLVQEAIGDNLTAIFNKMDSGMVVSMNEDGIDVNNTEAKELVTVVEQIQIKLATYCEDLVSTLLSTFFSF